MTTHAQKIVELTDFLGLVNTRTGQQIAEEVLRQGNDCVTTSKTYICSEIERWKQANPNVTREEVIMYHWKKKHGRAIGYEPGKQKRKQSGCTTIVPPSILYLRLDCNQPSLKQEKYKSDNDNRR